MNKLNISALVVCINNLTFEDSQALSRELIKKTLNNNLYMLYSNDFKQQELIYAKNEEELVVKISKLGLFRNCVKLVTVNENICYDENCLYLPCGSSSCKHHGNGKNINEITDEEWIKICKMSYKEFLSVKQILDVFAC
jgi:hypothetical protein